MRTYVLITSLLCGALASSAPTIVDAQTTAVPKNTRVVIYNVEVFDGYRMLRSRTVTIENGMIQRVAAAEPRPPADSSTGIDGNGMTLLPGLIDAHAHIGGGEQPLEQAAALGVTTALDMWGDPGQLLRH
jgi:imidazolonepropionase-like amidohydrolase